MKFLYWKELLKKDKNKGKYNENADKLQEIFDHSNSATENFKKLRDNKTLVVISKSNFNTEIIPTFFHTIINT